jgi:hypothetical protein
MMSSSMKKGARSPWAGNNGCRGARFMKLDGTCFVVLSTMADAADIRRIAANTRFTCCVNSGRSLIRAAL